MLFIPDNPTAGVAVSAGGQAAGGPETPGNLISNMVPLFLMVLLLLKQLDNRLV